MKRELIMIRHAKSSWEDPSLDDFDRPLNERGKRDAKKMADHIKSEVPTVDLLLSSSAARARLTTKYFTATWGLNYGQVMHIDDLYLASPNAIEQVVRSVNEEVKILALVGHNPGFTEAINLIPHITLDNLPTSGIYRAGIEESWEHFRFKNLKHKALVYPKMLPNE